MHQWLLSLFWTGTKPAMFKTFRKGEYTQKYFCSATTLGVSKKFYDSPPPQSWVYDKMLNETYNSISKPFLYNHWSELIHVINLEPWVGIFWFDKSIKYTNTQILKDSWDKIGIILSQSPQYMKRSLFLKLRKYENRAKTTTFGRSKLLKILLKLTHFFI